MIVHNFDPVLIDLGIFQIRWYSIAYILGIILGWIYAIKLIEAVNNNNYNFNSIKKSEFDDLIIYLVLGIIIGGLFAFVISIFGGIVAVKIVNVFVKKKINPLIGATGLSAVPMASRVANEIALKNDPNNHIMHYAMASNISGVIGSAVAAGILITFFG